MVQYGIPQSLRFKAQVKSVRLLSHVGRFRRIVCGQVSVFRQLRVVEVPVFFCLLVHKVCTHVAEVGEP
jgi:hypothetical protein